MPYLLLKDRFDHPPNITVYAARVYDYGLANADTIATGERHISVTTDPAGGYPVFTVPVDLLKVV